MTAFLPVEQQVALFEELLIRFEESVVDRYRAILDRRSIKIEEKTNIDNRYQRLRKDMIESVRAYVDLTEEKPKPTPIWQSELFTDAERDAIYQVAVDEIRDDVKGYAHQECNQLPLCDCIQYALEPEQSKELIDCLKAIRDDQADLELLTGSLYPEQTHAAVKQMERWNLAARDADGKSYVTAEGHELINMWDPE